MLRQAARTALPWLSMTAPATKCPVILVVESEFLIRMATAEAIRDAGFEVIEAMNADAAMDMLESRSDVQFVFTEIHIPGSMDGAELARAIKAVGRTSVS